MRISLYILATAATLCIAGGVSQAMPVTGGAVKDALDATNLVEKTAIYVVEGRRYCFYFNGWHGPGWYRCGFAYRRGFGWGGVYGWRDWEYGPAARRYGRSGATIREGGRREGTTIRERSTVREGTTTRGRVQQGGTIREGATVRGGANVRGETSGRGGAEGVGRSGGGGSQGGGQMNVAPSGGEGRGGGQMGVSPGGGEGRGGGMGGGDNRR